MKLRPVWGPGRRTSPGPSSLSSRFQRTGPGTPQPPEIFGIAFLCEAARFIFSRGRQGCVWLSRWREASPNPTQGMLVTGSRIPNTPAYLRARKTWLACKKARFGVSMRP